MSKIAFPKKEPKFAQIRQIYSDLLNLPKKSGEAADLLADRRKGRAFFSAELHIYPSPGCSQTRNPWPGLNKAHARRPSMAPPAKLWRQLQGSRRLSTGAA